MSTAASRPAIEPVLRLFAAADLAALPSDLPSGPIDFELDNGRLIMMVPPGHIHGSIQARFAAQLIVQGEQRGLGKAYSEVGIVLWRDPDRVVGADAAFVLNDSLPVRESPEGYLETIPELVVEIRSKNDTDAYLERKVQDYLNSGVKAVLVIDPAARAATVFRPAGEPVVARAEHDIQLDDVLPAFSLRLASLLED